MPLIRERDSKRLHIKSKLMGESLVGKAFFEISGVWTTV
jgi:molybdenum storage protein